MYFIFTNLNKIRSQLISEIVIENNGTLTFLQCLLNKPSNMF